MLRRPRGFTVVEMLVVISIIAVLMALLLPAVQAARETARRGSCTNNMYQLSKAIMSYDGSKGFLPASRAYPSLPVTAYTKPDNWYTDPNQYINWVHAILPEIGRNDLKEQLDNAAAGLGTWDPPKMGVVLCPSDVSGTAGGVEHRLSYGCNAGREDTTAPNANYGFDHPENGVFDNRLKGRTNPPPMSPDTHKIHQTRLGDVSNGDGATNTIMLAENTNLGSWSATPTEYQVGVIWWPVTNIADNASNYSDPSGDVMKNINQEITDTTIDRRFARPASYHPTGFNMAMCDGSVRFVSSAVQYTVYCRLMTHQGSKARNPGTNVLNPPMPGSWQLQTLDEDDY